MSPQRCWEKSVDVFDQLISKVKTVFKDYHAPATAPADPDDAAMQARAVLESTAQGVKAVLHQAEKQIDALLDASAQKIAHPLPGEKPAAHAVDPAEFSTSGPMGLAAFAEESMLDEEAYFLLPGVHLCGVIYESYA